MQTVAEILGVGGQRVNDLTLGVFPNLDDRHMVWAIGLGQDFEMHVTCMLGAGGCQRFDEFIAAGVGRANLATAGLSIFATLQAKTDI